MQRRGVQRVDGPNEAPAASLLQSVRKKSFNKSASTNGRGLLVMIPPFAAPVTGIHHPAWDFLTRKTVAAACPLQRQERRPPTLSANILLSR